VLPQASIDVDGDGSEWPANPAVVFDETSDSEGNMNTEIEYLQAVLDGEYLCFKMQLSTGGAFTFPHSPSYDDSGYGLILVADSDSGISYILNIHTEENAKLYGFGDSETPDTELSLPNPGISGDTLEFRVPLSLLGYPERIVVIGRAWSYTINSDRANSLDSTDSLFLNIPQ
jgi:hypothetical protein